jgi:hypothetical protein
MAAGVAAMNTLGMLGGFIGPYWMGIAKDLTGDYQHGLLTLTIPSSDRRRPYPVDVAQCEATTISNRDRW